MDRRFDSISEEKERGDNQEDSVPKPEGDRTFMEWWYYEIKKQGYDCVFREKEDENFDLDGSLASAWLFHLEIIEPRKNKPPLHKRRVHEEVMKTLPRQIGRGFGQKIRSQFK